MVNFNQTGLVITLETWGGQFRREVFDQITTFFDGLCKPGCVPGGNHCPHPDSIREERNEPLRMLDKNITLTWRDARRVPPEGDLAQLLDNISKFVTRIHVDKGWLYPTE